MDGWMDGWMKIKVIAQDSPIKISPMFLKNGFVSRDAEYIQIYPLISMLQKFQEALSLQVFILMRITSTGSFIQLRLLLKKNEQFSAKIPTKLFATVIILRKQKWIQTYLAYPNFYKINEQNYTYI